MDKYNTNLLFQKILANEKIAKNIFKYFKLDEQFILCKVCSSFQSLLQNKIWPSDYKRVSIFKTLYVNIVVNHLDEYENDLERIQMRKSVLSKYELHQFLFIIASSLEKLKIVSECYDYQNFIGFVFHNVEKFENLNQLIYENMVITNEQLQAISENCTKLQSLQLRACYTLDMEPIIPGVNLALVNIVNILSLRELVIKTQPKFTLILKFSVLQEIMRNMNLKTLILDSFVVLDNRASCAVSKLETYNLAAVLETLNIGSITESFWLKFKIFLFDFEQLRCLTINVDNCLTELNDGHIELLAKRCKYLSQLTLENCDLNIRDFSLLQSLRELTLRQCGGLTFLNFKQILGELELQKFALIKTKIYGRTDVLLISPTLESLVIDTILFTEISNIFGNTRNSFNHLKMLQWYNGDISNDWHLSKCERLEVLHIPNPHSLQKFAHKLKYLRKLTFTSCQRLSWSFLVMLLDQLSLTELFVHTDDCLQHDDNNQFARSGKDIDTSLRHIRIPFCFFEMAWEFWLELRARTPKMKLIFYGNNEDILDKYFICDFLTSDCFPEQINSINICGFSVDCDKLIYDYDNALHYIHFMASHYRCRSMNYTVEI